jgi:hypothetical protein
MYTFRDGRSYTGQRRVNCDFIRNEKVAFAYNCEINLRNL